MSTDVRTNFSPRPDDRYVQTVPPRPALSSASIFSASETPAWGNEGSAMLTVMFDRSSNRSYTYWAPIETVALFAAGKLKFARVLASSAYYCVRVINATPVTGARASRKTIVGYYTNAEPTTKKSQEHEHMGIVIKDQTLINGRDIKEYSDTELYTLIAKEHAEIQRLEALPVRPKKLVRQIAERRVALLALVELIDKDEPAEDAPQES